MLKTMSGECIAIDKIKNDQHIHIIEPKESTVKLTILRKMISDNFNI
ncbi:hypothetical protein [Staphylococcus hominis]|nr:hypothetical protein [Staphylococcus hominis]UXR84635.1 hypothetical protein MUA53_00455 [Staphylococcus hominis]